MLCDSVLYVLVLMFHIQSSIELLHAINHLFISRDVWKSQFCYSARTGTGLCDGCFTALQSDDEVHKFYYERCVL